MSGAEGRPSRDRLRGVAAWGEPRVLFASIAGQDLGTTARAGFVPTF